MVDISEVPERKGLVIFGKNPVTLLGPELKVGDKAPEFHVISQDFKPIHLSEFKSKIVVLSVTPSLETSVCDLQAKHFNKLTTELSEDVVVLNISVDLPFTLARWCGATGSTHIKAVTDYQDRIFGLSYGVLIKELMLLARSVWIIDKQRVIRYIEIVPVTGTEPHYEKALAALKKLITH